MIKAIPLFLVIFTISSSSVFAGTTGAPAEVTGSITKLRTHTILHPVVSARNTTVLKMSNSLVGTCSWLYIGSDDKETLSTLLMAKAQGNSNLTIGYSDTLYAPWGTTTCAILSVDVD